MQHAFGRKWEAEIKKSQTDQRLVVRKGGRLSGEINDAYSKSGGTLANGRIEGKSRKVRLGLKEKDRLSAG